ncbi:MAG: hypothetical protein KF777_22815 [Planctomycetaceae bacterium]|nr:hypothetical protein [Planctomycetaceae bacterium]
MPEQKEEKAKKKVLRQTLVDAQVAFAEALRKIEEGQDVNEVFGTEPSQPLDVNVACDSGC